MRDDELPTVMEQIAASDSSGKNNHELSDILTWRSGPQEDIL
jgi:hypothetical protein